MLLVLPLIVFAQNQPWKVFKSTHFLIFYKNANESILNEFSQRAEENYSKITDDLGFNRFDFWTWDNRAKIYLFDNQKDYIDATDDPDWAAGRAQFSNKQIQTFITTRGFLDNVLPHEMAHIIFREMVGFNNSGIPLWLEEGVATYQEQNSSFNNTNLANIIKQGNFIDLDSLSRLDISSQKDKEKVELFYAESYSLVRYLIAVYGKDKFVFFCQNLRDKRNITRALVSAYSFKDLQDFENSWKEYILK